MIYKYALKIYAVFINGFFVYKEFALSFYKSNSIKNILFSEKECWDELLRKGPFAGRFNVTFSKFEVELINKNDLIVPLTIPDLEFCIKNKEKMPNNPIPFPSNESFAICNNKSQFEYFMLQNGFSDYLPLSKDEIKFPFILKKSQDEGGVNTFIINNNKDLDTFKKQLNDTNYIKQSVIEGKNEYATHILIKDGKIKNALTIVYKFDDTVYIKGKDKYICRNICKNKHLEIFENILQTMDFNGLCCVKYKEKNGVPMILEINPRFGGSLCEYFYPFLQKVI
jgi:hypothetical protein